MSLPTIDTRKVWLDELADTSERALLKLTAKELKSEQITAAEAKFGKLCGDTFKVFVNVKNKPRFPSFIPLLTINTAPFDFVLISFFCYVYMKSSPFVEPPLLLRTCASRADH